MARYRSKPREIEAVQIFSEEDLQQAHLPWSRIDYGYVSREFQVYNRLHDNWNKFYLGDWLNITNLDDVYPINAQYFAEHYEVIE